jgi:cytochrome c
LFFDSAEDIPRGPMGGFVLLWCMITVTIVLACVMSGHAIAQDAAAGEKAFASCRACHQIGPGAKNAVGPVLNGVVGRLAGTYPGYDYSAATRNSGLTWDPETLQDYLTDPQSVIMGTKMASPGIKDPDEINDLIAFLKTYRTDGSHD